MKSILRKFICVSIFVLLSISSLYAYQLSPLSAVYSPSGAASSKIYTIVNDSDSPIAIEINAMKRMINLDGTESTEDGSAYFSIQPSKMIIKPQSTQLVRAQYRGPRTVTKEQSFRIVASQIPYSTGAQDQSAGQTINFLFVYSTAAYVEPTRIIERVAATAAMEDGKLAISITNTGSVHQLLNSLSVTVKGDNGGSYTLTEDELGAMNGVNLLTDSTVRIEIDLPSELTGATAFTAEVAYDYTYSS